MKLFIISDLHGDLHALNMLLEKWDGTSKLLFIGDLISRGPFSFEVLKIVKDLVEADKAILIMGNHEYLLLRGLDRKLDGLDYFNAVKNGGQTLISFKNNLISKHNLPKRDYSIHEIINLINTYCLEEIEFIRKTPLFCEIDHFIFVHGAVESDKTDLSKMNPLVLLKSYLDFYNASLKIKKTVVFGHFPTHNLNAENDVFIFDNGQKIAIDGGGCFPDPFASVNAILIDSEKRDQEILHFRYFVDTKEVFSFKKELIMSY